MGAHYARLALAAAMLFLFSTTVSAGHLDDHYLQQFGETNNTQLQKAILSASPEAGGSVRCGMPLKHGLKRDWKLLEQSTQKTLAKQLAAPVLTSPAAYTSIGGHFTVHYAAAGPDAPPLTDVSGIIGVPDWVETVAASFENVFTSYGTLGYRPAPTTAGTPYDVYLLDLAPQGFYGTTTSDQGAPSAGFPNASTSWMEIDNNFTDGIYKPNLFSPLQSLQITAAHEYHHAVQYGYNFFFDIWYAEATSTWMEDELSDDVNQLYTYITNWFNNSTGSLDTFINPDPMNQNLALGYGYGRWIFNRYLSEQHGPAVIRSVWESVAALPSPGGDIPMAPVLENVLSSAPYGSSLGNEFFGFAKRVYSRDWTTHTSDTGKIHVYSPVSTYTAYPVNSVSSPMPSVSLPHYSFAYYKFSPSAGAPTNLALTVNGTSGIKATTFIKSSGGVITEYPFTSASSTTVIIPGFSSSSEAVLLLANTTNIDNLLASFSTDGSLLPVPITGSCGSANNGAFLVAPSQNLCDSGSPSTVTGTGPWDWNCLGSNGGTTATCSAQVQTIIQDATITSGNGSFTTLNELELNDPILSPATKPANYIPTGAIDLAAEVTPGSTVVMQFSNLTSLPVNPVFYAVIGTQWIKLQTADFTFTGNSLTLRVIDNGLYDSNEQFGLIHIPLVVGNDITPPPSSASGSGCFIATAAFGSYLHPQVQLLRNFRDDYLLSNAPGRAFVALYYHCSPPLADYIARHPVLRGVTRLALTPLVVVVAHPLVLGAFLLLLIGALLRRIKTARSNAHRYAIRTT